MRTTLDDQQKHASILKLYENTSIEIQKLREFQWKVVVSSVTFSGALVALIVSDKIASLLKSVPTIRTLMHIPIKPVLTAVLILSAIFGLWCLLVAHKYLTDQRQIRSKIETLLGFHAVGEYGPTALLSAAFSKKRGFGFQLFGLVVPLCLIILATVAFALYLIWSV